MIRKHAVWNLFTLLTLALLLTLAGCKKKDEQGASHSGGQDASPGMDASSAPPPAQNEDTVLPAQTTARGWSAFLLKHTAGTISRWSRIEVHFTEDVVDKGQTGMDVRGHLQISPALEGKARFETPRVLVFTPDQPMKSGIRYEVSLVRETLSKLPAELENYGFFFNTIAREMDVTVDTARTFPLPDKTAQISGAVLTSDREKPADIEQAIRAGLGGQDLTLRWEHSDDGRTHRFRTEKVPRAKESTAVLVRWDGGPLGIENSRGERGITIPTFGVFKVTGARLVNQGGVKVEVVFSDPIDPQQDLKGLVTWGKLDVRTEVRENLLTVYAVSPAVERHELVISTGVRNVLGDKLKTGFSETFNIERQQPQARFAGSGVVLPAGERLLAPIDAINVHSVQVTAMRIYRGNINQFLQENNLDGDKNLKRVGRFLWRRTLRLDGAKQDLWGRYNLDLTDLIKDAPGAFFRLYLTINRGNILYQCGANSDIPIIPEKEMVNLEQMAGEEEHSQWDYYENQYGGNNNANTNKPQWNDRNNPCRDGYYHFNKTARDARNFLASNIGLLAKQGKDGKLLALTTNLRDGKAMGGVELEVRNFQGQIITRMTSDGDGLAQTQLGSTPYYLFAKKGDGVGYLKLTRGTALSTSHFEVGGEAVEGAVKGFIYGERDVWRPGDDLHLTFVLHDPTDRIPANHPVTMQLIEPKGTVRVSRTVKTPVNGFYRFTMPTDDNASTGNWTARALLGDQSFQRRVRLETIKPNRLSVDLQPNTKEELTSGTNTTFALKSAWLHGAKASGLKAEVRLTASQVKTVFNRATDFTFDDPTRSLRKAERDMWSGRLDDDGNASFTDSLKVPGDPAGKVEAVFVTKVFEESGDFSISHIAKPLHPYQTYVGMRMPKGDASRNMLLTDQTHSVEIATVTNKGAPANNVQLVATLYKLKWKWWWEKGTDLTYEFNSGRTHRQEDRKNLTSSDGRANYEFQINYPAWGRYLLRICDDQGGHCTGQEFYIDWPGWAGKAQDDGSTSAGTLEIGSDRLKYKVGESARLVFPDGLKGRALLSVENGSTILSQRWLEFDGKPKPVVELPITRGMAPNVYVSVTFLQPHQDRGNDRPLRLFGILPLLVEDPATHLEPQVVAPDEWAPNNTHTVRVREAGGKPMTYTLAMVDEGLLGLTGFATPSLHGAFYKREALGVLTWDMFDMVSGAYDTGLERLLALGGGESRKPDGSQAKKKRFPPVVRMYGPFTLAAKATAEHNVDVPQYLGAVRLMVVAGDGSAYGSGEKTVRVFEPLSVMPTLPRQLGPGEQIALPVTVFSAMPQSVQATINLKYGPHIEPRGETSAQLTLKSAGEQMHVFQLGTGKGVGDTTIALQASAGKESSTSRVFLKVRTPTLPVSKVMRQKIEPDATARIELEPHGLPGTNSALVTVSLIPPFGLEQRLEYLVRYPYGCVEQVTSAAFPQIYLPKLVQLEDKQLRHIERNVHAALERLRQYQLLSGSFSYWPGALGVHSWADVYAGHFIVEAHRMGFKVPPGLMDQWLNSAKELAEKWTTGNRPTMAVQAYRLFVLALAGKPDVGAMNRLRGMDGQPNMARWMLGSAYAQAGMADAAKELLTSADAEQDATLVRATFGSALRDKAILLQALTLAGKTEAAALAREIAEHLDQDQWHSTQSTGFALSALTRYLLGQDNVEDFTFELGHEGQGMKKVESTRRVYSQALDQADVVRTLNIRNTTGQPLHITITTVGAPPPDREGALDSELKLNVRYTDRNGNALDIDKLPQGKEIEARVEMKNTGKRNRDHLAFRFMAPNGWEIINDRMAQTAGGADGNLEFQDIRDDRVNVFFGLAPGKTRDVRLRFIATYAGRYYAPGLVLEDMYDGETVTRMAGKWVQVSSK